MKDALIAIYNILNQIDIKGAQNVINMYKIISIIEKLLSEIDDEDDKKGNGA